MEKLISISDLFKKSFEIYKKQFWTIIKLTALSFAIAVPLLICGAVLAILMSEKLLLPFLLVLLVTLIILLGVIILGLLLKTSLIMALINPEEKLTIKQYLKKSSGVVVSYFWVSFLTGLIIFGGFILLVIPGIILCVWFMLAPYVLLKENVKGWPALKKSKELVKGYGWPVFGRLIIMVLLMWFVSYVPFFGAMFDAFFLAPLFTAYLYIIYEDLKRIKSANSIA